MTGKNTLLAGTLFIGLLAGIFGVSAAEGYASQTRTPHRRGRAQAHPTPTVSVIDERVSYHMGGILRVRGEVGGERWAYEVQRHCDGRSLQEIADITSGGTTMHLDNALPFTDGLDYVFLRTPQGSAVLMRREDRSWSVQGFSLDEVPSIVRREEMRMAEMRAALRIDERLAFVPDSDRYDALRAVLFSVPNSDAFVRQGASFVAERDGRRYDFRYRRDDVPLLSVSTAQEEIMRVDGQDQVHLYTLYSWISYYPQLCFDPSVYSFHEARDLVRLSDGALRALSAAYPLESLGSSSPGESP